VPDFNFAKGSGSRKQGASSERRSLLDKYPARDLSHLEESSEESSKQQVSSAAAADRSAEADTPGRPATEHADEAADTTEPGGQGTAGDGAGGEASTDDTKQASAASSAASGGPSSKWPLIALLAVVLFLVLIAFIWHVDPWPSLREGIAGLFRADDAGEVTASPTSDVTPPAEEEADIPMRSWDYFLQVSSWKDLGKADLDAERYRAQGLDVIVESEFIPSKRGTFYRVRLGPYASAEDARSVGEQYASILPAGVFLDSTRLDDDEYVQSDEQHTETATEQHPSRSRGDRREAIPGGSEFDLLDQPLSGWAVKVSSFKENDIARSEAERLLAQGYPSFITRKNISGTTWYRVLVGPFTEKHDADRYMELLNVTYGNEAYTVNLATY